MNHVVSFSGGVGSWTTAKLVAAEHGRERLRLIFADTIIEDDDLYRFLVEAAANVYGRKLDRSMRALAGMFLDLPPLERMDERKEVLASLRRLVTAELPGLIWLAEGRDVWQVYREEKYIGNTQVDPCSKLLKREMMDRHIRASWRPEQAVFYVGIDWTEVHRFEGDGVKPGLRERRLPYVYKAPLCEPPYYTKKAMLDGLRRSGIELPRLYKLGFPHNNCGGFCCKAGQGQFARLYQLMPARYLYHEREEVRAQRVIGEAYTVLRDRVGGVQTGLSLRVFRQRLEAGGEYDKTDLGGCGCMIDE